MQNSWRMLLMTFLLAGTTACVHDPFEVREPVPIEQILVDKKIRTGMTQNEISEVLGPPKIIQKGARGSEKNVEVWLFDVNATQSTEIKEAGQDALLLKVDINPLNQSTGGTVEVRFDIKNKKAESLSYQEKDF